MKEKVILSDNTEIELEAGSSKGEWKVSSTDRGAMVAVWEKLTEENLKSVQIKTEEGSVIGNYADMLLVSESSTVAEDGSVKTVYALREKTMEEKLLERVKALEMEKEVLNGAVSDLGAVTSVLAEKIEGGAE